MQLDRPVYVLQIMNGNLRAAIDHVVYTLNTIGRFGQDHFKSSRYKHPHAGNTTQDVQGVTAKLDLL